MTEPTLMILIGLGLSLISILMPSFQLLFSQINQDTFIESESKRVGHVNVPNEIYEAIIRDGYHILLECSIENRVNHI